MAGAEDLIRQLTASLLKITTPAHHAINTPSFDWSSTEQYEDFKLFVKATNNWFALQGIEEKIGRRDNPIHLDYILNFLGNQGQHKYDRWRPATDVDKKSATAFLTYLSHQWITTYPFDVGFTSWRRRTSDQEKHPTSS